MASATIRRIAVFFAALLLGLALAGGGAQAQQRPISPWQGWYAGALVGVSWTHVDVTVPPSAFSANHSGIIGGAFLGFNQHLTETIIAALEGDVTFGDFGGDFALDRYKCSLVGHLGKLILPATQIYGLAGLACGHFTASVSVTNSVMTFVFDPETESVITVTTITAGQADVAKTLWGFVLGVGIETEDKLLHWPVRWGLEYRYTNFQTWNFTALGQAFSVNPDVQDIRLRLIVPFNAVGR